MLRNGYVVWEGASLIDGSPIVLILTGFVNPTSNRKTGRQLQSWILSQNYVPTYAAKYGLDNSICGDCPLKLSKTGSCYVNLLTPNNIYRSYIAGNYPKFSEKELALLEHYRYPIRLGSYGDPTAIPLEIWESIILASGKHTGYTHRHKSCDSRWQEYLMASVHSIPEAKQAQKQGWRTFRIIAPDAVLSDNEILCRHTEDDRNSCSTCLLCDGKSSKPNIADKAHGLNWKVSNFLKYLESTSNSI
ncbi:hypothetical protein [Calothrix sp. UHCC 0171]|uniref:hypothetical protein n=1 Tax=Calothrix sp. UHCC 0171 TaxID=3110245 RepID=UPI002B1F1C2B|nr:hypothetical protein [Calothrix sp. UHCC 0171]MEA5574634.1 hypothetical protein [Calothrix sp. UHCC 0171]